MRTSYKRTFFAFSVFIVSACTSRPILLDTHNHDDVGQVLVSASAVAPLGTYLNALGPAFDLSAANALTIAVPVSQSSLFRAIDVLRGGVAISRSTAAAPAVPASPVPPAAADGILPLTTLGGFPADRQIDIDPVLRYQAAARLQTEVTMLNRALRNAPFDPATEQAHLVQFNVTVMPHHDAAPYDAYVDLQVFGTGSKARLIPALLNDSIELTQQQSAKNTVRAFNLATTAGFGAIAAALGLNYANNQLEEVAGYSVNGITSVGRASDHIVRVRIAAQNQGRYGERFLAARTHNVFVVVITKLHEPGTTSATENNIALCSTYKFRRVNGGAISSDDEKTACKKAANLVVTLPDEEKANVGTKDNKGKFVNIPHLKFSASAPVEGKQNNLVVAVPAWDAFYLSDLRAKVVDCKGVTQITGLKKGDDFGKSLEILFARSLECEPAKTEPEKVADKPAKKAGKPYQAVAASVSPQTVLMPQTVNLTIERAQPRKAPEVVLSAEVSIPLIVGGETPPPQKPPAESEIPTCARKGTFVRAESLVIDQAGKGTLQALISLKPGAENKFTGETPLIPVFLQVEGADAITVTPGDEASSSVRKSRIAFKKSGRFSISLQNAVPDQQVVIDFATLKDKEFADSTRCMVIPVRLAFPKRKHKE